MDLQPMTTIACRHSTLSLQNGKCAELLPFVKLLHSYGLCPLNHQPYFPILQHCGINDPTKKTGLRGKAKVKELRLEGEL